MRLLTQIEITFGQRLGLSAIFQSPTIRQLSSVLKQFREPISESPLVPLRVEGDQTPLYLVHPGGGDVWCYRDLSQALPPNQPCYGLEAQGSDGQRQPLKCVHKMAENYLAAIRQQRPHGPYALAGWSFGGLVAFEIAQRLHQEREQVDLLAIIDSGITYSFALLRAILPSCQSVFTFYSRLDRKEILPTFIQQGRAAKIFPDQVSDEKALLILDVFSANTQATSDYRPKHYPGDVSLFQGQERLVNKRFDPAREWRRVAETVEHIWVPGNHMTMLQKPHVASLVNELVTRLAGRKRRTSRHAA